MSDKTTWRTGFASLALALAGRRGDIALDCAAIAGAGLVSYGAGLIYRPAGFIVLGGLLLIGAFLAARAKG